jgi:tetratricopeptide (TPR) repeat protein
MDLRRITLICLLCSLAGGLPAQDFSAAADSYVRWAEETMAAGRWAEALAGLERGADYADLSSDISYLLALARSRNNRPRGMVLEALGRALEARRWNRYSPEQALLLGAETLVAVRNFSEALNLLSRRPADADGAMIRLRALRGLPDITEFRRAMGETLERHPRDPRAAVIFFEYAGGKIPAGDDQALMDLVLRRLPYFLDAEPRLAFMAAPFIKDREAARRLVAAYRGVHQPLPRSIPASLDLGLLDETAAVEEFFTGEEAGREFDEGLIREIFGLLREGAARRLFRERLFRFSGVITTDGDRDGIPESRTRYRDGRIGEYYWDADQDGLAELAVSFDAGGIPRRAEQVTAPGADEPDAAVERVFAIPLGNGDRIKALIFWDAYPGVERSELEGLTYVPAPGEFLFSPISFTALAEDGLEPGLPFPRYEPRNAGVSRRILASFARIIRRPSGEFAGAVEEIELSGGIPLRAVETLEGRRVSATEFNQGKPVIQRVDLDLDGRMETIRRFKKQDAGPAEEYFSDSLRRAYTQEPAGGGVVDYEKIIEFSESDWDGDGIFETGEQYLADGTVVYSWDLDGDGKREYQEIKKEE